MEKERWKYRFDHFKRAYTLLQEANEQYQLKGLNQIEKEGMIQRFEFCFELGWKTIKDYLEKQGMVLKMKVPSEVIKEAAASKLIENGELWMQALDDRNSMSHNYDFQKFENVLKNIKNHYMTCFKNLYEKLLLEYNL